MKPACPEPAEWVRPHRALRLLLLGLALVMAVRGQDSAGQPAAPAATLTTNAATRFSFRAENIPLRQALALFAHANKLNIVPDLDVTGDITVDFSDLPLNLAMQALIDASGYYFVQDGPLIRVRNSETRIFQIDYINTTRTGQGSNAVQISSGGGNSSVGGTGTSSANAAGGNGAAGGNEGSTMTVTNSATINFWGDLAEQLKTMVSANGSYSVNALSGTVVVRDSHRRIEVIADFLNRVTTSVVRQIDLEVEIYEVALNNTSQLGINWQHVASTLDSSFSTMPGTGLPRSAVNPEAGRPTFPLLPGAGGLIVQTPLYGPAPSAPGFEIQHQRGNFSAVLDALKQQGELKVVSKPRLRTLNNQPAVVRVGQDIPVFLRQVTQSPGTPPVITETETIQTITVGTVLSITPQISSTGLITLDITPAVSRLVRIETSASGNTNAPVIDIRQASSLVRVRDGVTIVMGGLVQDNATSTRRKIPIVGDIPLLGKAFTGKYETKERTELVFFLTPRIITDAATEASAPEPALSLSNGPAAIAAK
ncbi:MAG TPA: secretin N-terminal domain-containing protein [Lacunisphaera sp.]|nr:secretin N-terminal domain-containing protein [Lacunisphaera sp.]